MVFLVSKTTTTLLSSQVQLYHNNNKRPQSMPFDRESLKKEQKTAFKSMLMYRDVLAVLPTRYGKSLAFQAY